MKINQKTLKNKISIGGVGLHTGKLCQVTMFPAEPNYGIQFLRKGFKSTQPIPALADRVTDTSRGTTIGNEYYVVQTVEHLLAALSGLEIDNVLVEVNGPEIPILDGSARDFVKKIIATGIEEQSEEKFYYRIDQPLTYQSENGETVIELHPSDSFEIEVTIDYGSSILDTQKAVLMDLKQFTSEIASARTFCFVHEVEALYKAGLIKGGDLSNAIVIAEKDIEKGELNHLANLMGRPHLSAQKAGILNHTSLRFDNEPARHKLLDLIGDLSLLGMPILGRIVALKPGHSANVSFVKMIRDSIAETVN